LRYENHLSIFKIHRDRKTTPKSLFYENFPRPFFEDDEVFINKYNAKIENFQNETMTLISETLEERINNITDDINEFGKEFEEMPKYSEFKDNFNDIKKYIYEYEEKNLLDIFVRNKQRAERYTVKKFLVKEFDQNVSSDTNNTTSTNRTSTSLNVSGNSARNKSVSWNTNRNENYSRNNNRYYK
jgi:uncharacterized protein YaaR (DUF327 family)